jgi:hypothetical protein
MQKKEQSEYTNSSNETDKNVSGAESNPDVYKKYSLTGKKLSQQEVDLIVARYKKERKS